MGKINYDTDFRNVKGNVHEAESNQKLLGPNSNCHYGWHCGGYTKAHAFSVAEDIAARYREANNTPRCCKYPEIDIAVIKSPGKETYYVEDRSTRVDFSKQY